MDRGSINNNNNNNNNKKKDNIIINQVFWSFIDINTDTNTTSTTKKDYTISYHGFYQKSNLFLFIMFIKNI